MKLESLKEAKNASPFRPFTIRMSDGRKFFIRHPDFLALSPGGRTVIAFKNADEFSILDALLMTEIEWSNPDDSKKGKKKS